MESVRCHSEDPPVGVAEKRACEAARDTTRLHVETAQTAGTVLVHLGSGSKLAGDPRAAVLARHASTSQQG
jgi:hypothetical protein